MLDFCPRSLSFSLTHKHARGLERKRRQLQAGMIVSNEPGFYKPGSFGIRIENLVAVVEKETKHQFGGVKYLGMESLTMVRLFASSCDTEGGLMSQRARIERYMNSARSRPT